MKGVGTAAMSIGDRSKPSSSPSITRLLSILPFVLIMMLAFPAFGQDGDAPPPPQSASGSQVHSDSGSHSDSEQAEPDNAASVHHQDDHNSHEGGGEHHEAVVPSLIWITPFVCLLLSIAFLPLIPATEHWWHKNSSKLTVALVLAAITVSYYYFREFGFPHAGHATEPGLEAVKAVLHHAVIADYIPFMCLLFSLFVISGGISVTGAVPAHPATNTGVIAMGGLLASFIGTTGAAMLLIRPLLQINRERRYVVHTVVFFIFIVCNIGGCLLPIGDPPLFLGYLRGVPFLWTIHLVYEWALCLAVILAIYYMWDSVMYRRESAQRIERDETVIEPIRIRGGFNALLLLGVVFAVGVLVPGKAIPVVGWVVPDLHPFPLGVREIVQLSLAGLSLLLTAKAIRLANDFNFFAVNEVACLFIGIFITMQVPVEILNLRGAELGLQTPMHFFWATGMLSSFLDNAPTYVVFFQTAGTLDWSDPNQIMEGVQTATGTIPVPLLVAISLGSVFMGANTYIGNGPNFMVKSIAEQAGVKMPSFFGYMVYSMVVLIPVFVLVSLIFFR